MFPKPEIENDDLRNKLQREEDKKNSSAINYGDEAKKYKSDQYTNYKPINELDNPNDEEKATTQVPRSMPSLAKSKNYLPADAAQKRKDVK